MDLVKDKLVEEYTQSILHGGEENGDCFRTAIACLMKIPPDEIPHFFSKENEVKGMVLFQEWLSGKGYVPVEFLFERDLVSALKDVCYILTGPSPRFPDELHCCVGQFGKVIWDPHPDRTGLTGEDRDWTIMVLIPINFQ